MRVLSKHNNKELSRGTDFWIRYIQKRIEDNKNFLGCFVGQTGSGKSYSAISLLELLEAGIVDERNIFMKSSDFIRRLVEGNLKKGTVLVWDEAGKDLNSKQWMSKANKVMNVVFQIFRRENIIVLFTLPYFSFLDSDSRKLIHALFETKGIDKEAKETIIKALLIQTNQDTGKMYKKFLRVSLEGKGRVPVKSIRLPMPSKAVIDHYEAKKMAFSHEVYKEALADMMELESKGSNSPNLSIKLQEIHKLVLEGHPPKEIEQILKISRATITVHLQNLAKKLNKRHWKELYGIELGYKGLTVPVLDQKEQIFA